MDLRVVQVVNPQKDTVELRPQEMLEVVFLGRDEVSWSLPYNRADTTRAELERLIQIKPLRWETYFVDGIERVRHGNFQIGSSTDAIGTKQNHYWFPVSP